MSLITRPLLSGTLKNYDKLNYPVIGTPKLDGIRALIINGQLVSRNFKQIPNIYTRNLFEKILEEGMDGELVLGNYPLNHNFNQVQSEIMSFEGEPDVTFCAFDWVKDSLEEPYENRIKRLEEWFYNLSDKKAAHIDIVEPKILYSQEDIEYYERWCYVTGNEGAMIRTPKGKYKCGRSTEREQILLKIKKFWDAEAVVIGFKEKMVNENVQEKDEFGLSKRSSSKDGLVSGNTLGTIFVRDVNSGVEFGVGSGFNDEIKDEIWQNQDKYLGKFLKYKYQELSKDKIPRFPVFLGFRHENDM